MGYCEKHKCEKREEKTIFGVKTYCQKCRDEEAERFAKEIEAEEKREHIAKMKKLRIEPMYYNKTFENFETKTDEQKIAKEYAEKLSIEKKGKLVMIGKNGTGKTHLAIAALKKIGGEIYTMFEISSLIRTSYSTPGETELQILNRLARVKLLVIDEVGRSKGSESESNWLSYIIDKRHVRYLPSIIISNRHLKKNCPERGCDKCIENYLDSDIISRLVENGKILEFTGRDYRRL